MTSEDGFRLAYERLEGRMRRLAEAEDQVYLPSVAPNGPVDHVLVAMEPSLGGKSASRAAADVAAGAKNFLSSVEDFLLHFAVRSYLCAPDEQYHITDISKGAMAVTSARIARRERYVKWYDLLLEEIDLVAKAGASVIAVGAEVARQFELRGFPRPTKRVLHYSGQAAAGRKAGVRGHEGEFRVFQSSISQPAILATARAVLMSSGVPDSIRDRTLFRVGKSELTTSRQYLVFNYKMVFNGIRSRRQGQEGAPRAV